MRRGVSAVLWASAAVAGGALVSADGGVDGEADRHALFTAPAGARNVRRMVVDAGSSSDWDDVFSGDYYLKRGGGSAAEDAEERIRRRRALIAALSTTDSDADGPGEDFRVHPMPETAAKRRSDISASESDGESDVIHRPRVRIQRLAVGGDNVAIVHYASVSTVVPGHSFTAPKAVSGPGQNVRQRRIGGTAAPIGAQALVSIGNTTVAPGELQHTNGPQSQIAALGRRIVQAGRHAALPSLLGLSQTGDRASVVINDGETLSRLSDMARLEAVPAAIRMDATLLAGGSYRLHLQAVVPQSPARTPAWLRDVATSSLVAQGEESVLMDSAGAYRLRKAIGGDGALVVDSLDAPSSSPLPVDWSAVLSAIEPSFVPKITNVAETDAGAYDEGSTDGDNDSQAGDTAEKQSIGTKRTFDQAQMYSNTDHKVQMAHKATGQIALSTTEPVTLAEDVVTTGATTVIQSERGTHTLSRIADVFTQDRIALAAVGVSSLLSLTTGDNLFGVVAFVGVMAFHVLPVAFSRR